MDFSVSSMRLPFTLSYTKNQSIKHNHSRKYLGKGSPLSLFSTIFKCTSSVLNVSFLVSPIQFSLKTITSNWLHWLWQESFWFNSLSNLLSSSTLWKDIFWNLSLWQFIFLWESDLTYCFLWARWTFKK